jgi:predicted GNAT family N-acyltransferase
VTIEVRDIQIGSSEYQAELALRNAVLRLPLGLELSEKDTANDANEIHLGAFLAGALVGCLLLRTNSPEQVQMRQVAVDPAVHGRGVGRRLVEEFERRARGQGAREIVMDARETARPFYEKLGYQTIGSVYIQSTIPHVKMRKSLTA